MNESHGHKYFWQCECAVMTLTAQCLGRSGCSPLDLTETCRELLNSMDAGVDLLAPTEPPGICRFWSFHFIRLCIGRLCTSPYSWVPTSSWTMLLEPLSFHNFLMLHGFELEPLCSGAHIASVLMQARMNSLIETSESCLQIAEWVRQGTFPHPHCAPPFFLGSHFPSGCCVGRRIGVGLQKVQ